MGYRAMIKLYLTKRPSNADLTKPRNSPLVSPMPMHKRSHIVLKILPTILPIALLINALFLTALQMLIRIMLSPSYDTRNNDNEDDDTDDDGCDLPLR
jgi:hypothetical protein